MKHSYKNHGEIAKQFINGIFDGSAKYCRNAHTDGARFWSYSTEVAHKHGGVVVIDSYFYSVTTRRQTQEIELSADRWGWPVVHCGIIDPKTTQNHQQNKGEILDRIFTARKKYRRARSEFMRSWWSEKAEEARRELINYDRAFNLEPLN